MDTRAPEPGCARLGKGAGPINNLAPFKIGARRPPAWSRTRWLADPHVEFVPFSRTRLGGGHRPTSQHRPTKLHADPRVSKHTALSRFVGARFAPLSSPPPCPPFLHLPSPQAQGSRAPGGAGAGRGVGRRRPKRRSREAEGPEL